MKERWFRIRRGNTPHPDPLPQGARESLLLRGEKERVSEEEQATLPTESRQGSRHYMNSHSEQREESLQDPSVASLLQDDKRGGEARLTRQPHPTYARSIALFDKGDIDMAQQPGRPEGPPRGKKPHGTPQPPYQNGTGQAAPLEHGKPKPELDAHKPLYEQYKEFFQKREEDGRKKSWFEKVREFVKKKLKRKEDEALEPKRKLTQDEYVDEIVYFLQDEDFLKAAKDTYEDIDEVAIRNVGVRAYLDHAMYNGQDTSAIVQEVEDRMEEIRKQRQAEKAASAASDVASGPASQSFSEASEPKEAAKQKEQTGVEGTPLRSPDATFAGQATEAASGEGTKRKQVDETAVFHQEEEFRAFDPAAFTDPNIQEMVPVWNNIARAIFVGEASIDELVGEVKHWARRYEAALRLEGDQEKINNVLPQITNLRRVAERARIELPEIVPPQYLRRSEEIRARIEARGEEGQWTALAGVIDERTGLPVAPRQALLDRRLRDLAFNNLFATVDNIPNQFFREAFNPLTQGARYEDFIEMIRRNAEYTVNEIKERFSEEELLSYANRFPEHFQDLFREKRVQNDDERLTVIATQLKQDLANDLLRYQKERQIRETIHDANAILYIPNLKPEELYGFTGRFGNELGDIAQRVPGVRKMKELYERQVEFARLEHGGWLSHEDVVGATRSSLRQEAGGEVLFDLEAKQSLIEQRVKEQFRELYDAGLIYVRTGDGRTIDMRDTHMGELEDWEINRLIITARGLLTAELRLLSLAAKSELRPGTMWASAFLQNILHGYAGNYHFNAKWGGTPGWASNTLLLERSERKKYKLFGIPLFRQPYWSKRRQKESRAFQDNQSIFLAENPEVSIHRLNPHRAGDLYTHLGRWRIDETTDSNISSSYDMIVRGREMLLSEFFKRFAPSQAYLRLRRAAGLPDLREGEEVKLRELQLRLKGEGEEGLYPKYFNEDPDDPRGRVVPGDDVMIENLYIYRYGDSRHTASEKEAKIREIHDFINEHGHWIGTGLRFELLRSDLDMLHTENPKDIAEGKEAKGKAHKLLDRIIDLQPDKMFLVSKYIQKRVLPKLEAAWQDDPRCRENGAFSKGRFYDHLHEVLGSFNILQQALYEHRDRLLKEGYTFDGNRSLLLTDREAAKKVQLDPGLILTVLDQNIRENPLALNLQRIDWNNDREVRRIFQTFRIINPDPTYKDPRSLDPDIRQGYIKVPEKPTDREDPMFLQQANAYEEYKEEIQRRMELWQKIQDPHVRQFHEIMRQDHATYKDTDEPDKKKEFKSPSYEREFITKREYYHGFNLWSGDAPTDEFNMTVLGPTGSFGRKALDNTDQAAVSVIQNEKVLGNLKNVRTPYEAAAMLGEMYSKINGYDFNASKKEMYRKGLEIADFYSADWKGNVPILGVVSDIFGWSSVAQKKWGRRMPVWRALQKREFFHYMYEKGFITKDMEHQLRNETSARKRDVALQIASYASQIILLVLAFYIFKKTLERD